MYRIQKTSCIIIAILCIGIGIFLLYQHNINTSSISTDDIDTDNIDDVADSQSQWADMNTEDMEASLSTALAKCITCGEAVADYEMQYKKENISAEEILDITNILKSEYMPNETVGWYATTISFNYTWKFVEPYEIDDTEQIFSLWQCIGEDEIPLVYTTAWFDPDTNMFHDVSVLETMHGKNVEEEYMDYSLEY